MVSLSSRSRYAALFAPIGWGMLSYLVFSVLKPLLPLTHIGPAPLWMWLWLLQMISAIPFWVWMSKRGLLDDQRHCIAISKVKVRLGKPAHYLLVAYLAGASAIPFYDKWYGQWLAFGGIVSPIFEELFSRNFLAPWLEKNWASYLFASAISCTAFSLMHWGFNNAEAFGLALSQQGLKFLSHFIFALVLCVIFRFTKSIQLLIWLHIASNLQFLLTKL